ncbi:tryptophan aminotransferase-related protein 2-like [Asparagus officinalis]|uniref:tryptophan aminotransferase-related protein 2-like n=1 Tax=Asparagus officinalis TaxID=4686 RepID=UPI00098E07E3|nr:tryptophan aminotransferase-related protein 2-like [Asparagus officinalis]
MASAQAKQSQRKLRSLWAQPAIWCIAVLVSLAVNLVSVTYIAPLFEDLGDERNRYKVNIVHEKEKKTVEKNYTAVQDTNISATSGSRPIKDSIINLDHGDPTIFEEFWARKGEEAAVVIPGWQALSYFSDAGNVCWFLERDFGQEVRRLHKLVGNAVTEDRYIVVGTGSTQLYQAAVFALSPPDASEPMSVVSAAPYYSAYHTKTAYLRSGLFRWAGDARAFKGDSYIEVVCYPNNPDGFMNKAVLSSDTGKTIHDLAYYWPQYTAITEPADHDIMLFTISKSTGHAGTRLGWAVVKDQNVAKKMTKFIELNTIGVSKDSQLRAAKILKVISDGYELPNTESPMIRLFDYGRDCLGKRWKRLREAVKATGLFSLPEYPTETCKFTGENFAPYPGFAWMKCEKEEIEDCESFLKGLKILTRGGKHFGVGMKYVRVSMLDREETFNLFIERLESLA